MKEYRAEGWLPAEAGPGEIPLYRREDDTFFFLVDIKTCRVHLDEPITRLDIVEGRPGYLTSQTRLGLALLNSTSGAIERITDISHADAGLDKNVRMNHGGIDTRRSWWASTTALRRQHGPGHVRGKPR